MTPLPTTPAQCYAAQKHWLKRISETESKNWRLLVEIRMGKSRLLIVDGDEEGIAEVHGERNADLIALAPTLGQSHADLLGAHAKALAGIEGLAIDWEATAAKIFRTEVRPDGRWVDIESAQAYDGLMACARQLRALLPSPPVEDLANPDDNEPETDPFLVGQRVVVHGTLRRIHDTSDSEDADEIDGEPGVIVADVTDNPHHDHLVYVPGRQRVYGCVIADLSTPESGNEQ